MNISVHFRRLYAPDYNSQALLNLPFSKVNYSPDLLISVIVNMFHLTANLHFNRFSNCRLTISETVLEESSVGFRVRITSSYNIGLHTKILHLENVTTYTCRSEIIALSSLLYAVLMRALWKVNLPH